MADKKVYFYKVSLFDVQTKTEKPLSMLKDTFLNAYRNNLTNDSLLLNDNQEEQINLDIKANIFDENGIFGTIGKMRDISGFRRRNRVTNGVGSLINPEDLAEEGLECFTYFILDFEWGILSVVSSQSSPSEKIINNVLAKYNAEYYTEIMAINSREAYRQLFSRKSKVSKLSFKLNTPSIEVMLALGIPDRFRLKALENDSTVMTVTFKSAKKKPFADYEDNVNEIQPMIEELLHNEDLHDIIISGNPSGNRQRDFSLTEAYCYDTVSVKPYKVEDAERVYLTLEEIEQDFRTELVAAYRRNREDLKQLINRL